MERRKAVPYDKITILAWPPFGEKGLDPFRDMSKRMAQRNGARPFSTTKFPIW